MNIIILVFVFITFSLSVFSQGNSVDLLLNEINQFEKDQQYDTCIALLVPLLKVYDENWFKISKELIYLNEKTGNTENNLQIFTKGHELGYFYFIHPALPKFKPYKAFAKFDTIVKTDIKLRENVIKKAETIYETQLPINYSETKIYPLCIIFHGGGSNLNSVKKHWHSDKLDSGYIKVYVQSFRHYDSETFGWRSGEKRTDEDIQKIYNELNTKYKIDTTNIIVCGISAGGTCAIDLSVRQVIPVKGFITFCSGISANITLDFVKKQSGKLKGFIVGGENDYYLPKQKQMTEIFDNTNFAYKHIIVKDIGHQYPDNENDYINEALKFFKNE